MPRQENDVGLVAGVFQLNHRDRIANHEVGKQNLLHDLIKTGAFGADAQKEAEMQKQEATK